MAKFYVLRGRKALVKLIVIAFALWALFYVFWVDHGPELEQEILPEINAGTENVIFVEPVSVRPIPTKFSEYKLEREKIRSRQIELLQNFVYDPELAMDRRAEAQQELKDFVEKMSREAEIENLLKAKGYVDGLVILDQNSVTIVVPVTLTFDEVARIGELVHRLTDIKLEQITIVDESVVI